MRQRYLLICGTILALTMLACSVGSSGQSTSPTDSPAPTANPQNVPPLAPTNAPFSAPTQSATAAPLIGVATMTPVTGTDIITVTPTLEGTPGATVEATTEATAEPQPTQQPPPPVSSGPLDFTVDVAGCRADPSREGGVVLSMRFNPSGGNGVYRYFDENIEKAQIFDRPATKGSSIIDAFRVDSSDGQSITHKFQFKPNDFCKF